MNVPLPHPRQTWSNLVKPNPTHSSRIKPIPKTTVPILKTMKIPLEMLALKVRTGGTPQGLARDGDCAVRNWVQRHAALASWRLFLLSGAGRHSILPRKIVWNNAPVGVSNSRSLVGDGRKACRRERNQQPTT
jgi:hypothetical protein